MNFNATLLGFGIIVFSSHWALGAGQAGWDLKPRFLPVPQDVSQELQDSLKKTSVPDFKHSQSFKKSTHEEWRKYVEKRDSQMTILARFMGVALSVNVREDTFGGVNVHWATPDVIAPEHKDHLMVFVHGGAWVLNAGKAGTVEAILLAHRLGMRVLSVDYRMPPKHPAPAALDDLVTVWKEVLRSHKPRSVAMGGTSAGGNISLAALLHMKSQKLPLPGALYLGTPAVDLNQEGDSRHLNEGVDRLLISWIGLPSEASALYRGKIKVNDPRVSPIFGDFKGLPPTYLVSGTRDLLLSDTVRTHRKLRRAGVKADLHVFEGHSHADYLVIYNAPESFEHFKELKHFYLKHLTP